MMNWARWLLGLPLRTVAGCQRKVRYREASAQKAAVRMEQKTGWKFDAYPCPHCDGWHIGKRPGQARVFIVRLGDKG